MERTVIGITLAVLVSGVSGVCLVSCGTEEKSPPSPPAGLQVATDIEHALDDYQRRLRVAARVIEAETRSGSIDATEMMNGLDAMELIQGHLDGDSPTEISKGVRYIMEIYDGIEEQDRHKLAGSLSPHIRRVQERWNALVAVLDPPLKKIEAIASAADGAVPSMNSIVNGRELAEENLDKLLDDVGKWQERVGRAISALTGTLEVGTKWDDLPDSHKQFHDVSAPTIDTLGEIIEGVRRLKVLVVATEGLAQIYAESPEFADATDTDQGELRRGTNAYLLRYLSESRTLRRQLEEIIKGVEPSLAVLERQLRIGTERNGARD